MRTPEERRLQTRICLHKYQGVTIDTDTNKRKPTGVICVRVEGRLVPEEEAYYLEKELYNDHKIPKSIKRQCAYVDRMKQWDAQKFNECNAKLEKGHISSGRSIQGQTVGEVEKFLTLYNGYPCRLSMVSESTDYSGYDYTCLQWVKVSDIEQSM